MNDNLNDILFRKVMFAMKGKVIRHRFLGKSAAPLIIALRGFSDIISTQVSVIVIGEDVSKIVFEKKTKAGRAHLSI